MIAQGSRSIQWGYSCCKPKSFRSGERLELFSDSIDWRLIETHLPDMLRVALSIKAGRITPSAILRRLSSYNRHNRLYQAFRELGRALRTEFLLRYLADPAVRTLIQAATNKSESFNRLVHWLAFGGDQIIATNDRAARRKIIKGQPSGGELHDLL